MPAKLRTPHLLHRNRQKNRLRSVKKGLQRGIVLLDRGLKKQIQALILRAFPQFLHISLQQVDGDIGVSGPELADDLRQDEGTEKRGSSH